MRNALRLIGIGLLLGVAACTQQGRQSGTVDATARYTYVTLAEIDHADAPSAVAAADATLAQRSVTGNKGPTVRDGRTKATFQYYFVHAIQAARPRRANMGGSGQALGDALLDRGIEGRLELQAAMDDLLARYPDRHDVSGALMRGGDPERVRYIVKATFRANGAVHTLYYDLTAWAGYTQEHG